MEIATASVHASAVLIGNRAMLIRGPAGSGKTRLALTLIGAARANHIPFARLVADDRVEISACHGRLLVRPPAALAGLIEVRGVGIRRMDYESAAVAGWVIDLDASDAERMPSLSGQTAEIDGIKLPRLALPRGADALATVLAALRSEPT